MEKAFLLLLLNLSLSFLSVTCYDPSSHLLIRFPPTHPPTRHHHHEHHQHHHQHHYPHHHAHPPQPHRHPPHHPQPAVPPTKQPPPAKPPTHPPVRTPYPPHHPPPAVPPTKSPPPVKSPAHPPVKTPTHPPLKPPTHPRAPPTAHPPTRKLVAVQGVVFCKSCNYTGINTLTGASPLPGARVMLKCKNTIFTLKQTANTDKNGYFFLQAPPQITTYGAHKCKVYLASPPSNSPCQTPTNLHDGVSGAVLVPEKVEQPQPLPFSLYTVGPFAYEPPKCPRH